MRIGVQELDRYEGRPNDLVKVGTYHRGKGLEFKAVFLPGLSKGVFPRPPGEGESAEEAAEARDLAISQLFVAMTRARDLLVVLYDGEPADVIAARRRPLRAESARRDLAARRRSAEDRDVDVFELRDDLIAAYRQYATSFMRIRDERIQRPRRRGTRRRQAVAVPADRAEPGLPSRRDHRRTRRRGSAPPRAARRSSGSASRRSDAVGRPMTLHQHQVDAIRAARDDRNYVLTTGTGSGKSLSYIVPIVDHVLRTGSGNGVKAIVVYPMNALANSQFEELGKFLAHGPWGQRSPVTYARYTGQESDERPPGDPPATARHHPHELRDARADPDPLPRPPPGQPASTSSVSSSSTSCTPTAVARAPTSPCWSAGCARRRGRPELLCVGTSATLSTEGSHEDRQAKVGEVASLLFGAEVRPSEVITRDARAGDAGARRRRSGVRRRADRAGPGRRRSRPTTFDAFVADPLSVWIEATFGLRVEDDRLVRATPLALDGPERRRGATGRPDRARRRAAASDAIRAQLMAGYEVLNPATGFPVFAFRLHQFLSRGDTVYASPEPARVSLPHARTDSASSPVTVTRALLPLAFCRACGQDYYVVHRQATDDGSVLVPRDLGDTAGDHRSGRRVPVRHRRRNRGRTTRSRCFERLPDEWLDDAGRLRVEPSRPPAPAGSSSAPTARSTSAATSRRSPPWPGGSRRRSASASPAVSPTPGDSAVTSPG